MSQPLRLSVVMIARDERENVRACFDSFWDHVDEVVLCDTGSRDGTIGEARRYARERGEPGKLIVGRFKWCDDFAAARNHAHSLATGDVHARLDLDERIIGAEHLPRNAARFEMNRSLSALLAPMQVVDEPLSQIKRPQIFRAPVTWSGRTWENVKRHPGPVELADGVSWEHVRRSHRTTRDLDIALDWARDATSRSERADAYLFAASEANARREFSTTVRVCDEALALHLEPDSIVAGLLALKATALYGVGSTGPGEAAAQRAVDTDPESPEVSGAWLVLARAAVEREDWEAALAHALKVRQYRAHEVWQALLIAIDAAVELGQLPRALVFVKTAIGLFPDEHPLREILERQRGEIRHALARERQRKLLAQIPLAAVERAMAAGLIR